MKESFKSLSEVKFSQYGNTNQVFWSKSTSAYICLESEKGPWLLNGKRVALLSVNGGGEVRWPVWVNSALSAPFSGFGGEGAVAYFGLVPA